MLEVLVPINEIGQLGEQLNERVRGWKMLLGLCSARDTQTTPVVLNASRATPGSAWGIMQCY